MGYRRPTPRRSAFHQHMRREWQRFQRGTLRSGHARKGPVVRDRAQFVAIALSAARAKGLRGAPRRPRGR